MITMSKRKYVAIILSVVIAVASITAGGTVLAVRYLNNGSVINTYSASKDIISNFNEVNRILRADYFTAVDENKMLEGAVSGMAFSLNDPYTQYFTKQQMADFNEQSQGSYTGIGLSLHTDKAGFITIIEVFDGSPAKAAGILPNDVISKVDGKPVGEIGDESMVVAAIKGIENTNVTVTMYRSSEDKYIDFEMTRKTIKIENIKSRMINADIGYIRIVQFDSAINSYFGTALKVLEDQGMKSLIIDVRNDPGGSYSEVVTLTDRFLSDGLIVYTQDRAGNKDVQNADPAKVDYPLVILVNENSASASEILAGALKDRGRAKLVGTKTFGKGLVQSLYQFADGAGLKFTIANYFTPSGISINKIGIEPDYVVTNDPKYDSVSLSDIPANDDMQLNKALELLKAGE